MSGFVHLHVHSEYSLLDGACKVEELPVLALENGHEAVAITDHGVMYGTVNFYKACKKHGIKPILGCEFYVCKKSRFDKTQGNAYHYHLILLAKDKTGYDNLSKLNSLAFLEGFYSKPRIDLELLEKYKEGLICLSACYSGYIPQCILNDDFEEAVRYSEYLLNLFGKENFYLELQYHGIDGQKKILEGLSKIHERTGIPFVATNDVHYSRKSDAEKQAILMCIQTNQVISDGRPLGFETDEFYYKSTEEMERLFGRYEGALENTVKIAQMCNFDFDFSQRYLPEYRVEGETPEGFLKKLAYDGFKKRTSLGHILFEKHTEKEYLQRIEYEFDVITRMGYTQYYLIVWDFVNYAKNQKIPVGPGRGSGAGSLIAYLIGITDVDSIKYDLLFERFLNPERVSMPDFDIDFCYNRRDEVVEYLASKYGHTHVSQIITFGTMAARAVVRDVGRAMAMPYNEVDEVARLIPRVPGTNLLDVVNRGVFQELEENNPKIRKLIEVSLALEGMPRHASKHAAGVVITNQDIYNYIPVAVVKDSMVTQFDMDTIAELGLLKFDLLALRYLTIISDTEEQIRKTQPDFDIQKVSDEDKETYELLSAGQTSGLFQLESAGMTQLMVHFQANCLEDIMTAIALYRPGPMDSIPRYLEIRRGKIKQSWKHIKLLPILSSTYGCIVYQEQVMRIFRDIAGYSLGHADIVRRAMSKKKASVLESERGAFVDGAMKNGMSEVEAGKLFDSMADFAKYAFNKSHAAAYAILSFRTAYLKAHYKKEFFSSLLTSVLDNGTKMAEYIAECEKNDIKILPPDINESEVYFCVKGDNIRYGLLALKNIGKNAIDQIIQERERNGNYTSFDDFVMRVSTEYMSKRQVETLIRSGVFDALGKTRSSLLAVYDKIIDRVNENRKKNLSGQIDLFSAFSDSDSNQKTFVSSMIEYPDLPEFSLREKLWMEKDCTGFYFSGHILEDYTNHMNSFEQLQTIPAVFFSCEDLGDESNGKEVMICGMVNKVTTKSTRSGETMAFVNFEDRFSQVELIVFPKVLEKYKTLLKNGSVLAISGKISIKEDEDPKIIVLSVIPLVENASFSLLAKKPLEPSNTERYVESTVVKTQEKENPKIYLKIDQMNSILFERVMAFIHIFPGNGQVIFYDTSKGKYSTLKGMGVLINDFTVSELKNILGNDCVILK